ncbi:MAG TPA: patatin-like phospholipase family protein [Rhizobiaceae bacterium]|nr:patatin-like phospholipase family protein [Rhizobiaceae bacterium]
MTHGKNGAGANAKPVNLALQGGGSHGAFTWGVLDALLADGRLKFQAISGASAGAMNAVVLADGWVRGGAEGARQKLEEFWRAVADRGSFSPIQRTPFDRLTGNWAIDMSPGYLWFDAMSRFVSPYMANPFNLNPLLDVLHEIVDFDRVRACKDFRLFIATTNVRTGKPQVFEREELTAEMVMASACLPHLFQAVEIDGIPYWDGGYGGNPPLWPFFYANRTEDVLLVQINAIERPETPRTAREIQDRIDEITFNAGLLREFRAMAFVQKLLRDGRVSHEDYRDVRMHRIDADGALSGLAPSTKVNAEWAFLVYMRDLGIATAQDWLEANFDAIGREATLDLSHELDEAMDTIGAMERCGARTLEVLARPDRPRHFNKPRKAAR